MTCKCEAVVEALELIRRALGQVKSGCVTEAYYEFAVTKLNTALDALKSEPPAPQVSGEESWVPPEVQAYRRGFEDGKADQFYATKKVEPHCLSVGNVNGFCGNEPTFCTQCVEEMCEKEREKPSPPAKSDETVSLQKHADDMAECIARGRELAVERLKARVEEMKATQHAYEAVGFAYFAEGFDNCKAQVLRLLEAP